jgi:hypothetical protein
MGFAAIAAVPPTRAAKAVEEVVELILRLADMSWIRPPPPIRLEALRARTRFETRGAGSEKSSRPCAPRTPSRAPVEEATRTVRAMTESGTEAGCPASEERAASRIRAAASRFRPR